MNRKQKNVLIRILVAAALLVLLHFLPLDDVWGGWLKFAAYLVPYAVIGWVGDAEPFYRKTVGAELIKGGNPENSIYSNMIRF